MQAVVHAWILERVVDWIPFLQDANQHYSLWIREETLESGSLLIQRLLNFRLRSPYYNLHSYYIMLLYIIGIAYI